MPSKSEANERRYAKENAEKFFVSPHGHIRDRVVFHPSMKIPREGQFISLNGYGFLVKPGEEIDLPRPVRLMVDTLIETETIQGEDGKQYTRDVPRFTYTLVAEAVNMPSEPEQLNGG